MMFEANLVFHFVSYLREVSTVSFQHHLLRFIYKSREESQCPLKSQHSDIDQALGVKKILNLLKKILFQFFIV